MKKILLIIALYFCAIQTYAQTTYYWVGASGSAWTAPASWNTVADGSGTGRAATAANDILIFDGANPLMGTANKTIIGIPRETVGSITIKNSAKIILDQPVAFEQKAFAVTGTLYGGSTVSLVDGSNTNAFADIKVGDVITNVAARANSFAQAVVLAKKDDNTITVSKEVAGGLVGSLASYYVVPTIHTAILNIEDAASSLTFGITSGGFYAFAVSAAGGSINGSVIFNNRAGEAKLIGITPNNGSGSAGLRFKSGSSLAINGNSNGKNNFNLGSTIGQYQGSTFIYNNGSGINNTIPGYTGDAGIVFESGSTYSNNSAAGNHCSPFGSTIYSNGTDLVFTPATLFESGSTYNQNSTANTSPYFYSNANASYPNLDFKTGVPANFSALKIDNLTFSAGNAAVAASTGTILVKGNITNNSVNSINLGNVILAGTTNQTITGTTGALVFGDLTIADKAIVTLASNTTATNVNHLGALNFGTNTITGTGNYYAFGTYSHATTSSDFTIGSSSISGVDNAGAGTLTYYYPVGASVSNATYIPTGTIYRAFPSPNGTLSTFAKATGTGQIATFSNAGYTFTNSAASPIASSIPGFTSIILDINGSTVLPLDLITFAGKLVNNEVALNWKTENENGVSYFSIEKRNEGDADFKEIGKVNATNQAKGFYHFNDKNLNATNAYYRLKTIDENGKFKYSNVVAVKLGLSNAIELKAYPNPAINQIEVLHAVASASADITIVSIEGKVLYHQAASINATKTTINVSEFVNGIYFVIYKDNNTKQTVKFVKN